MYTEADALALLARACYIDGHADSVLDVLDGKRTLHQASDVGHWDFPRARQVHQGVQIQVAWTVEVNHMRNPAPARRCMVMLDALKNQIAADPEVWLVRSAAEIRAARTAGKLGVMLGIEGAEPLEDELACLRMYYELGVRIMGLTWNYRNAVADGALEWASEGGLTRFGRQVVQEMNHLGMLIDCAHLSPKSFEQVLAVTTHPVLFTHGNCRALFDHPRNLADDQIKALAQNGGVFGISFVGSFMGTDKTAVSVQTVVEHIDHVAQLVGHQHVAIGSDFDGTGWVPIGLETVQGMPALVAALLNRGYSEAAILDILGENYLRVFAAVLDR